jgi:hypothetical protein
LTIALDRLQAALELERVEKPGQIVEANNDPPQIIVSQEPALLIRIDGQPVLRQVAGTGLLRVINTRVLLPRDGVGGPLLLLADEMVAWSLAGVFTAAGTADRITGHPWERRAPARLRKPRWGVALLGKTLENWQCMYDTDIESGA